MRRAAALCSLVLLALPAAAGARVLVVGDSLEVGTAPYLKERLRGVDALAVDARVGRPSDEGLRILRAKLTPADDVVVFDLGTNDGSPAVLGADLAGAAAAVGDRCLVVSTIVRPRLGAALTGAVDSFASAHPTVQVVPWRETVAGSHGVIRGDGVHATPQGYALRARLVAEAVQTCLAGAGATVPGVATPAPPPPSLVPDTKVTPLPTPRPHRARPSGFRLGAYRAFAPLLTSVAVGALLGPPSDGLQIVTR